MLVILAMLMSCSKDDDTESSQSIENGSQVNPDAPHEELSIVGVWKSGKYFVSFDDDAFCCAYFADKHLDCGFYARRGDTIENQNLYYANATKYVITELSETKLDVKVEYIDMEGVKQTNNLSLIKTDEQPTTTHNPLIGKTFSTRTTYFGMVSTSFLSYYTALYSSDKTNLSMNALSLYYIYYDGKIYFQQFYAQSGIRHSVVGGWGENEDITVWKINMNTNGSIDSYEDVTASEL